MPDTRSPSPAASGPGADPAAWSDALIAPCQSASTLAEGQPRAGVLWVTAGEVSIGGRRAVVARKGDIVAYSDDGSLRWSATDGTHVRWSAREVEVRPGDVRPWTPQWSRDLPTGPAPRKPVDPRRRAVVATVAWVIGAWAIAWLVGCSPSSEEKPAAAPSATKDGASAPASSASEGSIAPAADGSFFPQQIDNLDRLMKAVEKKRQDEAERKRLHEVLTQADVTLSPEQEATVLKLNREFTEKRNELMKTLGGWSRGSPQIDAQRNEFRAKIEQLQTQHETDLRAVLPPADTDKFIAVMKQNYPGVIRRDRPSTPKAPAMADAAPAAMDDGMSDGMDDPKPPTDK